MKVLHVVDSLGSGGMENGLVNLANGLRPDVRIDVACLVDGGAFARRLPAESEIVLLGKTNGFSPAAVLRLFNRIRRTQPAFLHTHNLGPLIYASLATAGGRFRRILHGEHSQLTAEERSPRRLRQRSRLYRSCAAVHVVAPAIQSELEEVGCFHPAISVTENGVDTDRFSPGDKRVARQRLNLPEDALVAGLVGRFGREKGHRVLFEAFEQLAPRFPDLHIVAIGAGGPAEGEIRERASQSAFASRIHFTGYLAEPQWGYRALDLLVLPSTNEGMANAVLEGMASGVPVLANTGCGHEAMIEDGCSGVIRDLRTADRCAAAMHPLLDRPEQRAALAAAGRTQVAERFSLARMLERYSRLYRAVGAAHP